MPHLNDASSQQAHTTIDFDTFTAPILVSTRHHGSVELRQLSLDDVSFVIDLAKQQISPQEFASLLLSHQSTRIVQDADYFSTLPLPALTHIASTWLKREGSVTWVPSPEISLLQTFQDALASYATDWQQRMKDLADTFSAEHSKIAQWIRAMSIPSFSNVDVSRSVMRSLTPAYQYMPSSLALNDMLGRIWIPTQPLLSSTLERLDLGFSYTIVESIQPALANLNLTVASLLKNLQPGLLEDIQSQAGILARAISQLSSTFTSLTALSQSPSALDLSRLLPSWDASVFISHLPHLSDLLNTWEQARRRGERLAAGHLALAESGYEFADHLWTVAFVESFADVNPQVRSAVVNKRMAAVLRTKRFESHLQTVFAQSDALGKRWPYIVKGLKAHGERDYETSIPLLMIQIEGVIGDMLLVKGLVAVRGRKLYARDMDGRIKLDSKGKAVEIRGMGSLVDQSDFKDHEVLKTVAQLVKNEIVGTRNPVLHGVVLRKLSPAAIWGKTIG